MTTAFLVLPRAALGRFQPDMALPAIGHDRLPKKQIHVGLKTANSSVKGVVAHPRDRPVVAPDNRRVTRINQSRTRNSGRDLLFHEE